MFTVLVAIGMGRKKMKGMIGGRPRGSLLTAAGQERKVFLETVQAVVPGQLIAAAFQALTNPHDLLQMTTAVGEALTDKRIQLWLPDDHAASVLREMGWDGAVTPGDGDYLYLVDNKRNANKIDFFTETSIDYTITVDPDGTGHAVADITLDPKVPKHEAPTVVGPWKQYGLNVAMLSLHVPKHAKVVSYEPTTPTAYKIRPTEFLVHKESGVKVFTKVIEAWDGHPGTFQVTYDIPNLVQEGPDGSVYSLTLQHQPVVQSPHVTVRLVLPEGSDITNASPGWRVHGSEATYEHDLDRDLVTSVAYR